MLIEAGSMLPSLVVALCFRENPLPFLFSIGILIVLGLPLALLNRRSGRFHSRVAYITAGISWLTLSLFGALPFLFCGQFPSFIDCLFESISGFTTTGSTILTDVEVLPKGILFWRNFTHFIGGMGIIVLTTVLLPTIGDRVQHLMQAEVPGPTSEKLVPKLAQSSKILYAIYVALTVLELLALLCCGLSFFDALNLAISTAGTGGFAIYNASIAAFASPAVEIVISVFMLMFGVNFSLYFLILCGKIRDVLKNTELRFYLTLLVVFVILITWNIYGIYGNLGDSLRNALFSVSTLISTTGFGLADFDRWPTFSKTILVLLMFTGACAGSTAGGLKLSRIYMMLQSVRRELRRIVHPNSVSIVRMDGRAIGERTLSGTMVYLGTFVVILFVAIWLVSLEGHDIVTSVTSVIATIGNIGPGLALVGPVGNYSIFSAFSKIVLCLCMLIGRLEIYPILLLFAPSTWKK